MGFLNHRTPKLHSAAQPDAYETIEMPAYPEGIARLGLQLYPANYFEHADLRPQEYVAQEEIPGIATTLIVDRPDSVVVLIDDRQQTWHTHQKTVFTQLKERLSQAKPYDVSFVDLGDAAGDDGVIALIDNDDITAATHALALDRLYPQLLGSYGALVGIPLRHLIIVKKLQHKPGQAITAAFQGLVHHMAHENDGYLSDAVYWYHGGSYHFAPFST